MRLARLSPFFAVAFTVLSSSIARADAPALIPVQGFLTDEAGVPVDGEHRLDLALYDAATDGSPLYTTSYRQLQVENGQFVVYLGENAGEELDLALFAGSDEVWLEVAIDGDQIISPRTHFASVPYAAFAEACGDSANLGGRPPEDYAPALAGVPAGAVMAFDLDSCPNGWSPFSGAEGRTIIGAGQGGGLTARSRGQTLGEETHTLTLQEMPAHSHGYTDPTIGTYVLASDDNGTATEYPNVNAGTTTSAGGDAPHNVMQPSYVLLYCKKD